MVQARLPLGADQPDRGRSRELRPRQVARALEADSSPGGHRQRRRHRRLLPESLPLAAPGRQAEGPRPLRRNRPSGARRGLGSAGPHGFEPRFGGLLRDPSGLVCRRSRGKALSGRRILHRLRQLPLLRRVPAGRPARDRRALPPRRLCRQQLDRAGLSQRVPLRALPRGIWRRSRRGSA